MKYTEIGYFGPSTNVRSAPIGDDVAGSVLAALDRLPRRRTADVITFPRARGPQGEPLRFIVVEGHD